VRIPDERFAFRKFKPPPGMSPARLFHGHESGGIAIKAGDGGGIVSVSWRSAVWGSGARGCGFEASGDQEEHVSSSKSQNRHTFNSMTMSGIGNKVSPIPSQRGAHAGPVPA
jgi:hypothetical protein